jgi:O-methyltransferase
MGVIASVDSSYLDLLKKCLLASIYDENAWYVLGSQDRKKPTSVREWAKSLVVRLAWARKLLIVKPREFDGDKANWGLFCYTMIGLARLNNIQTCVEDVVHNCVEGDLIETGVWRGGATIFMRAMLKAHGITDRTVWVADSFEGLPALTEKDTAYKDDTYVDVATMNDGGPLHLGLAVSLDRVKENFNKFGLLDNQVQFLKGWFRDTLPTAPIKKLSILRVDCDLYQPTMDVFNALYSKVSRGGYVIVDDYNGWHHCKQAVDDFREAHGIRNDMIKIDEQAVCWKV